MPPDKIFFNTGITTYFWILDNNKEKKRKGKIQLLDVSSYYKLLKMNLGAKNKEVTADHLNEIFNLYQQFENNKISKIYDNNYFGYTKITIDQYLKDDSGNLILDKKKEPRIDKNKRDYEKVPLDKNIEDYLKAEVNPNLVDYVYDKSLNKVGYEISLTKEFYKVEKIRDISEIQKDIKKISEELIRIEKDFNE